MIYYLISAVVVGLDQLAKYLVVRFMELGESIPVWPGVFHLTSHRNAGAAFGILQNQRLLFILITIAVVVWIAVMLARFGNRQPRTSASLALVLGGAIGNFIDRVRMGEVVDFLDVRLINFPIFNLADAAITIGVALLLLDAFFATRRAR